MTLEDTGEDQIAHRQRRMAHGQERGSPELRDLSAMADLLEAARTSPRRRAPKCFICGKHLGARRIVSSVLLVRGACDKARNFRAWGLLGMCRRGGRAQSSLARIFCRCSGKFHPVYGISMSSMPPARPERAAVRRWEVLPQDVRSHAQRSGVSRARGCIASTSPLSPVRRRRDNSIGKVQSSPRTA
jgi:hypothetical protein